MERSELIQRIKEISISFPDMDPDVLLLIIKQTHNTFSIISDEEILKIINNIKTTRKNVKGLSTIDMIGILNTTSSKFDKSDFKEVKKLGSGTYGSVSKFKTPQSTFVAIKTIKDDGDISSDFIKEVGCLGILRMLGSKYIPEYCGFGRNEICLEFADSDLFNWWTNATKDQLAKHLPRIVDDLLKGLSDMQSVGLINGDIKPENMLVWYSGDEITKVAYTDFGLCSSYQQKGALKYTSWYRPPEYFDGYNKRFGQTITDFQTDCWALAKSILTLCMTQTEINKMAKIHDKDNDDATKKYIETREIRKAPKKFKRYLRDDQVSQLTRMISADANNRCIVSVRELKLQRKWGWIYGNKNMTTILFEWMFVVVKKFKFKRTTLLLSYDILTRYFEKYLLDKSKLQGYASASMYIASQWSGEHEDMADFVYINDKQYTRKELFDFTYDILNVLDGLVWIPGMERFEDLFLEADLKTILKENEYDLSRLYKYSF